MRRAHRLERTRRPVAARSRVHGVTRTIANISSGERARGRQGPVIQRARNLFGQNKIAIIWDFDKTLIPYDMQRPLFEHYEVDEETFWRECNALPDYYRARGYELVSRDQMYLLHILSYVKAGRFEGLNNSVLRELGARLTFYNGLPRLFQSLKDHILTADPEFRAHDIA